MRPAVLDVLVDLLHSESVAADLELKYFDVRFDVSGLHLWLAGRWPITDMSTVCSHIQCPLLRWLRWILGLMMVLPSAHTVCSLEYVVLVPLLLVIGDHSQHSRVLAVVSYSSTYY